MKLLTFIRAAQHRTRSVGYSHASNCSIAAGYAGTITPYAKLLSHKDKNRSNGREPSAKAPCCASRVCTAIDARTQPGGIECR